MGARNNLLITLNRPPGAPPRSPYVMMRAHSLTVRPDGGLSVTSELGERSFEEGTWDCFEVHRVPPFAGSDDAQGPKGEKRPADVVGNAVHGMRIAAGEAEGGQGPEDPAAVLGRKGGSARAKKLTPERRREIAKKGAASRWSKPE